MTHEMARYSVGDPDKINRTVTATITKEQWVYGSIDLFLYFNNGVLESFQDAR